MQHIPLNLCLTDFEKFVSGVDENLIGNNPMLIIGDLTIPNCVEATICDSKILRDFLRDTNGHILDLRITKLTTVEVTCEDYPLMKKNVYHSSLRKKQKNVQKVFPLYITRLRVTR